LGSTPTVISKAPYEQGALATSMPVRTAVLPASPESRARPSLDELFGRAQIVSLHVPLTAETRSLVDANRLESMRPDVILVNTSRGDVVAEAVLIDALSSGRLRAAALDVFAEEPPPTRRLLELPNVIRSPHIAGLTQESLRELMLQAATSALDVLAGRPNPGIVNPGAMDHERHPHR
jgi:phosphoglycerate dehydrogenase-like enzyme